MKILTFDLEEWFHILDNDSTRTEAHWAGYESRMIQNTERILDLLERRNQKATFFCLGWIARKYPQMIRLISERGYDIGSHSYFHQLVYEHSRDTFEGDLKKSINTIEDLTGKKIRSFRAPGFSITEKCAWAIDSLIEHGIEIDCSVFPARRLHGGFESIGIKTPAIITSRGVSIKEFPISPVKIAGIPIIFSGGGYFRLLPYAGIRRFIRKADYVMTYFHPRDFDPDQPVIRGLPLSRKLRSYYGLGSAFIKLEKLLDDFQFIDLAEADRSIEWANARRVSVESIC